MGIDIKKFEKELREFEREKYFLEHQHKLKKSYNVGIIGLGHVGRSLATRIGYLIEKEQTLCTIDGITLIKASHGDLAKAEATKRKISTLVEPRVIPIRTFQLDELDQEIADSLDVCFISYRAISNEQGIRSRDQQTLDNLPFLRDKIASLFNKDYDGTIVVVSNLTDTLAYAFAQYSDIDPRKIIGMNHLDDKRFVSGFLPDKVIEGVIAGEIVAEDVEAYVWGCHDNPHPCFDKITVRKIDISDKFGREEKDSIEIDLKDWGKMQVQSGESTWETTSKACIDTLIAIMDEEKVVTASTLYKCEDGTGVYIGLPAKFKDGCAERLHEDWLDGIIESKEFGDAVIDLKKRAKKAGLKELVPGYKETILHPHSIEGIVSGCSNFLELNERNPEVIYILAKNLVQKITYSKKDIDKFIPVLKKFQDKSNFNLVGYYLSALLNKVSEKGQEFVFDLSSLDKRIDALGSFAEGIELTIKGDVGNGVGYRCSANIHIEGNAGNYAAYQMEGGNIMIDGNVLDCAGQGMIGGHLEIRGDAKDMIGEFMKAGTITINGRAKEVGKTEGGVIHLNKDYKIISKEAQGEVYHKGEKVK